MAFSTNRHLPAIVVGILIACSSVDAAAKDVAIDNKNQVITKNGNYLNNDDVGNSLGGTLQISTGTIDIYTGSDLTTWGQSASSNFDGSISSLGQDNQIPVTITEPDSNGTTFVSLDPSSTDIVNISGINISAQPIPEPASLGLLAASAVILHRRHSRGASEDRIQN